MHGLKALASSLGAPFQRPLLVFYLYVAQALFAAAAFLPLQPVLERQLLHSALAERALRLHDEALWTGIQQTEAAGLEGFRGAASWIAFLYVAVAFTLLSGGTFALLADRERRASVAGFLAGGGHCFFRFLRLLVLFLIVLAGLAWLNRRLDHGAHWLSTEWRGRSLDSRWLALIAGLRIAVSALLVGLLLSAVSLTKARAVTEGRRGMSWLLLGSLWQSLRRPVSALLVAGFGPAAGAVLLAVYLLLRQRLPESGWQVALQTPLSPAGFVVPRSFGCFALAQLVALGHQAVLVAWAGAFLELQRRWWPPPAPVREVFEPQPPPDFARPTSRDSSAGMI